MTNLLQLAINFLRAGTNESAKRLIMIMSYLVTLSLCIVAVTMHYPIEYNVVTLLLACCGVSTTGYVVANKNEQKQLVTKDNV